MNDEPTTEQQGTPIVAPTVADWGNDVRIVIPGLKDEQGNEQRPQEKEEEIVEADKDIQEEVEEYEAPQPQVYAEDPGEFQPKDYTFEVIIYDDEGKKPKTIAIKEPADFDRLIDDDANFGAPGALLKAQRLAIKMENGLERDETDWRRQKDLYEEQAGTERQRQEQIANIGVEINYLVAKGSLPDITDPAAKRRWNEDGKSYLDKEFIKTPGIKEQLDLLAYMRKENDARTKAGLRPLTSALDAFNAMQLEQRDRKAKDVHRQAGEARKAAGARVAGVSPAPTGIQAPKGIAVGRGGSLRDLGGGW